MMVTHSPFVLSDIPNCNVLCLGEGENTVTKTLGGNIMEMLSSSFFMNNSIGEAIKEEISAIVTLYNKAVRKGLDVRMEYAANKVRIQYICDNLGDEFLKSMVSRMVVDIVKAIKRK